MGFIKRWATLPGKSRRSVRIAVIGESLNTRWEKSWDDLAHSPVNYPIQSENGIDRVSYYRHAMQCWNIKPQKSASHLRSLILFVNRHTLERIGGFHIGQTKEKCIAAEIAFSQSIKALNGFVGQVNPSPFFFMRHREWHVDTNGQVCKVSSE